jgi:hypothetical protein
MKNYSSKYDQWILKHDISDAQSYNNSITNKSERKTENDLQLTLEIYVTLISITKMSWKHRQSKTIMSVRDNSNLKLHKK